MSKAVFAVNVLLPNTETLIKQIGLDPGGRVQRFFSAEVMRVSAPYVPFAEGVLHDSARLTDNDTAIIYDTPYARYHWYGKLMVDPDTEKGAFHNPKSGRFWSRPGVQKILTDKTMKYRGAPLRGPHWVTRAMTDNGDEVVRATEGYINGGGS